MHQLAGRVERRLDRAGARLSAAQVAQLVEYLALLERWNHRVNLTGIDDPDFAVDRLIVEPVLASTALDAGARSLLDIGSGGGSPALPLKIARPDLALTMVEVKTRKSVFLREVIRHLGLQDAIVENARVEQVVAREPVMASDAVSVRAVRAEFEDLKTFAEALRPGGQLLWFLSMLQQAPVLPEALVLERELPLVEALNSRLLVLRKCSA